MSILEQSVAAADILITWGFWIVVYGLVTMLIGLIIIGAIAIYSNKSQVKFIK